MNQDIKVSSSAANKIRELTSTEEKKLLLRVYIVGGGCSGFQYGFSFEKSSNPDDSTFTFPQQPDIQVIVDPMSLQYLHGAEIDYKDSLQGSHFVVNNPNAKTTCGCGSSFSA